MDRTLELEITDALLDLLDQPTMSLVDEVVELPATDYTDPQRWARERTRIFGDLPLLAALSGELAEPGAWKLFDAAGPPIVLVRGDDGVVRGFLNACRHRGAIVVEEPRGTARKFSCPYHSWVYDRQGALVALPHPTTFEGICREERGLRPVSVAERDGAIWVLPRSTGAPIDLDAHLGPMAAELARWDLGALQFVGQREHRTRANWKLAMDTFTEAYHIPNLHAYTIGTAAAGGLNISTPFGRHHRQALAMKPLEEMRGTAAAHRDSFATGAIAFVYIVFPNTAIVFFGDHAELFQVFPGQTVDTSVTLQSLFAHDPIDSEDQQLILDATFDFVYTLVAEEDYRMAANIQRVLSSGVDETFLLGRCEAITQAVHAGYRRLVDA